ncbi:MAG: ABC transporter ATP-binding protein [Roseburia sp.]
MKERICVKSLQYAIDDTSILKGVSLKVVSGQMVGIIGPNGSGKTTFLKHIYRSLPAKKNTVFINHREIETYSYKETAKLLTVMKQENASDFDFRVMDMVLLGRSPYHNYFDEFSAEDKEKAIKALQYVGLENAGDKFFKTLSGGEKQRVLMARSIVQETDIYILDEPTNHLDVHYQWAIMDMIHAMGKTVLGVFHELNLASKYCDYLYILNQGTIVAHGEPQEVITQEIMRDIFQVDVEIIYRESGKPYIIFNGAI